MQQYNFWPFFWGMSDVDWIWYTKEWEQAFMNNVDCFSNQRLIQLAKKPSNLLASNLSVQINAILKNPSWSTPTWLDKVYLFCNAWEIYNEDGILQTKISGNVDIVACWLFWGDIYWINENWQISRIWAANASAHPSGWLPSDITALFYTLSWWAGYPALNIDDTFLYIWTGNNIVRFDNTRTPVVKWTLNSKVVWLTRYTDEIYVHLENGTVYYRDLSNDILRTSLHRDTTVRCVVNNWVYDHIFEWIDDLSSNFKRMSWRWVEDLKQIKSISYDTLWYKFKFETRNDNWATYNSAINSNIVAFSNNIMYIPWNIYTWTDRAVLYTWGTTSTVFPEQMSIYCSKNVNNTQFDEITAVYSFWKYVLLAYKIWTIYNVWYINTSEETQTLQASWYVITNEFDWTTQSVKGNTREQKKLLNLRIWADIPANTSIDIYYSIDWWSRSSTPITFSSTSSKPYISMNIWLLFYYIKFKIVLNTNWANVRLHDFIINYDVNGN